MRTLLVLEIWILVLMNVLGNGMTLAPGLSLKNLVLYIAAAGLIMHVVLGGRIRFNIRPIAYAFLVLVLYAVGSTYVTGNFLGYAGYDFRGSIIKVKAGPFDWAACFLVAYCVARKETDVRFLTRQLLIAIGLASVLTVIEVAGSFHIGVPVVGLDNDYNVSRVNGVFGHANETGSLMALLLPAYLKEMEEAKGFAKAQWLALTVATFAVLVMTASRGSMAGLVAGSLVAAVTCRRYISGQLVAKWLSLIGIGMVPVLAIVGFAYWDMLVGRFASSDTISASALSSGRTDFWLFALQRMFAQPISLLTGFGWNSFEVSGSSYAMHNQYLALWYELGLVGVLSFLFVFGAIIRKSLRAMQHAPPELRRHLLAFVFSALTLLICLVFMNPNNLFPFFWIYAGVTMRVATLTQDMRRAQPAVGRQSAPVNSRIRQQAAIRQPRASR